MPFYLIGHQPRNDVNITLYNYLYVYYATKNRISSDMTTVARSREKAGPMTLANMRCLRAWRSLKQNAACAVLTRRKADQYAARVAQCRSAALPPFRPPRAGAAQSEARQGVSPKWNPGWLPLNAISA